MRAKHGRGVYKIAFAREADRLADIRDFPFTVEVNNFCCVEVLGGLTDRADLTAWLREPENIERRGHYKHFVMTPLGGVAAVYVHADSFFHYGYSY